MEKKTDFSEEFGPVADHSDREFSSVAEPVTDRGMEFYSTSVTGMEEFGGAYVQKEFFDDSKRSGGREKTDRRKRHRHTLLLQMAAAALSVVVVTSSFGEDILGGEQAQEEESAITLSWFSKDSHHYMEDAYEEPTERRSVFRESAPSVAYDDGSVRYDRESNTLFLNQCDVDLLEVHRMGDDFTIYVEEDSRLGRIIADGESDCSVHIDSEPGKTLWINQDIDTPWVQGITLAAGDASVLSIGPEVTMVVHGALEAVAVSTRAEPVVVYDPSRTQVSGQLGTVEVEMEESYLYRYGAPVWTFLDESGRVLEDVVFRPVEQDGLPEENRALSEHSQLSISGKNGSLTYLVQDGQVTSAADRIAGLQYDPETNTLVLNDYTGGILTASMMGDDFTVRYEGENSLEAIVTYGDSAVAPGSLHISGSYTGSLSVNADLSEPFGIHMNAGESSTVLRVCWVTEMEVYGSEAAVLVENSSAELAVDMDPVIGLNGNLLSYDAKAPGCRDWHVTAGEKTDSGNAVPARFYRLFTLEEKGAKTKVEIDDPLYLGAPYGNPGIAEQTIGAYGLVDGSYSATVVNEGTLPVYIYLQQYRYCNETTLVEDVKDNWDVTEVIDMQGRYYCSGGVLYLTKDGQWQGDVVIDGANLQADAALVQGGESLTFSLPQDGTDSIYMLYATTYDPKLDYYWWVYSRLKIS